MPKCKNDASKSYTGREPLHFSETNVGSPSKKFELAQISSREPSPKGLGYCAHAEKVGTKRKGKDGNLWIVKKVSNGSLRWMKYQTAPPKLNCQKLVMYEVMQGNRGKTLVGMEVEDQLYPIVDFNTLSEKPVKININFKKLSMTASRKQWIKENKCNPRVKELLPNNDEYLSIKEKHEKDKVYFIHDNGARPFAVYVSKQVVTVYRIPKDKFIPVYHWQQKDKKNIWMYVEKVKEWKYQNIFIGKDSDASFHGNSILIHIKKLEYVYVGSEIYSFTPLTEIKKYYSPVGNSDVPYPYAVDDDNNGYLMLEKVILLDVPKAELKEDIYLKYYRDELEVKNKKMKVKIIQQRIFNY